MKNNFVFTIFSSMLSIILVGISLNSIYAQENVTDADGQKFFAIQQAKSGSISEINATAYTLELNDVSDKTILFSDRPDRIVMSVSTSNFIGNWSTGVNNLAVDPPNAVLVVDDKGEQQDVVIIELFNPIYDVEKKKLIYEIAQNITISTDLQEKFGQSTLMIDEIINGGAWTGT